MKAFYVGEGVKVAGSKVLMLSLGTSTANTAVSQTHSITLLQGKVAEIRLAYPRLD